MVANTDPPSEVSLLNQIIGPTDAPLPIGAAEWILKLQFSEEQRDRMQELAERGNAGTLSTAEHEEMTRYRNVGMFLSLLNARARLSLKQALVGG